jgi:hypothetical protein
VKKTHYYERGAAHVIIFIVAVLLVGVVGFVGYNAWQKQSTNAGGASTVGTKRTAATPPSAASICGSGYVAKKSQDIKKGNEVIAQLNVLSKGKTYCAVLISKGSLYVTAKLMDVTLGHTSSSCKKTYASSGIDGLGGMGDWPHSSVQNSGTYKEYAGPVRRDFSKKQCVFALSSTDYPGAAYGKWGFALIVMKS